MSSAYQTSHFTNRLVSQYLDNPTNTSLTHRQFTHHPSEIAKKIITLSNADHPTSDKFKIIKWISYATFCQPVLVSYSEKGIVALLKGKGIFDFQSQKAEENYQNLRNALESLNILCLVKGFSLEVLEIKQSPVILKQLLKIKQSFNHNQLCYLEALWRNSLPFLTKNRKFAECQIAISQVGKQDAQQLQRFLVETHQLKKQVHRYLENNPPATPFESIIHPIDIKLSECKCLVTAEYLPEDYKQEYIEIWIDRTVQLNSLLGNFVCRQKVGEFQYMKGPLTYAMEKGILLVLNNFEHISNELLVGMRTLAEQMKIFHNQKTVQARGGFKILGICNAEKMSLKMRNSVLKNQYIVHLEQSKRSILDSIDEINHEENKAYITLKLKEIQEKMGLISAKKLWKRIVRARKDLIQGQGYSNLWSSRFTEGFKNQIEQEINDIISKVDPTKTIHYEEKYKWIKIGRVKINITKKLPQEIVKTQYSLSILERLALCSQLGETPLLISQTGCGKTTLAQYLAKLGGHQLFVYNMSSGTDVMDLVGGFKPIDCKSLLKQLLQEFKYKFSQVPVDQNFNRGSFLDHFIGLYDKSQYYYLLGSLCQVITKIMNQRIMIKREVNETIEQHNAKKEIQKKKWQQMKAKFESLKANSQKINSSIVFSFIEGNLVKAIQQGHWVLIDEINMATNDVLQKIVPLIQGKSIMLYEKGDLTEIKRHQNFRIIACMNPANDSGKKPLPPNLMQKFTAINLPEPTKQDILMMLQQMAPKLNQKTQQNIADIYFEEKKRKTISLRNLSRCLDYFNRNLQVYGYQRALYDSLLIGFQHKDQGLFEKIKNKKFYKDDYINMEEFLIKVGKYKYDKKEPFLQTEKAKEHLKDLLRAVAGTQLPVLIQGPTSAGKTSIIRYVANESGHKCIRINNHQHTQIQEYLGNYYPDKQGNLAFREGPLVQAVREGYWLILDELNLARTEILECLNRLLDDNRELFIPEQQIHIKPHKNFRIFATQNPPTYSGRKTLSRAFKNRFISLKFDEITTEDTMQILKFRTKILQEKDSILLSFISKTLEKLTTLRLKQRVFSKNIVTIRDLLKWTTRDFKDKQDFVKQGYALLAERLRTKSEKKIIQKELLDAFHEALQKAAKQQNTIKRKKMESINMEEKYQKSILESFPNEKLNKIFSQSKIYVQMNKSFKRMAALTDKAISNNQPVLLVGETGCGKTTLAELLAYNSNRKFYQINCHKHTEASDLLGSLRPCTKSQSSSKFQFVNGVVIDAMLNGAVLLIDEINTAQDSVLERLNQVLESGDIGVERGEGWETINAKKGFCVIATMNPSGDYGKKQLSPALRNRFTQIWVEPITHSEYIVGASNDIMQMISHKLSSKYSRGSEINLKISGLIYEFMKEYNCNLAAKYGLSKKLMTMRDIGWICKFMVECEEGKIGQWELRYYWAIRILAIEGVNFMIGQYADSAKLQNMKEQIICFINKQLPNLPILNANANNQLQAIQLVKNMQFPLLIKTDLPLPLLNIQPNDYVFFSPHTQLSDLLGQFHPKGKDFIWQDETLLKSVKNGQRLALMDINLAQQPVIEGINSLFDHRGSIFVVELNRQFKKNEEFRPVVVLKQTAGGDRRGLPNSFLNRFIKIRVKDVSSKVKIDYLKSKFESLHKHKNVEKLWEYAEKVLDKMPKTKIELLEYVCEFFSKGECYLDKAVQILNLPKLWPQSIRTISLLQCEQQLLQLLPLTKQTKASSQLTEPLINSYITLKNSSFSLCLIGCVGDRDTLTNWIGYSVKKSVVKVILSTMTDMADMLGSYEQVEDDYNEEEDEMQNEGQISSQEAEHKIQKQLLDCYTTFNRLNQSSNRSTNFKYIKSRIMTTLACSKTHLLYVEVPNQSMLQRVEKGLKQVYHQKVSIIVGIDECSIGAVANTKLIAINLNPQTYIHTEIISPQSEENKSKQKYKQKQQQTQKYFEQNYSNIKGHDKQVRMQELTNWINDKIGKQLNKNRIAAWQKLYEFSKETNKSLKYDIESENKHKTEKSKQIAIGMYNHLDLPYKEVIGDVNSKTQYFENMRLLLKLPYSQRHQQLLEKIINIFDYECRNAKQNQIKGDQKMTDNYHSEDGLGLKFQYLCATLTGFKENAEIIFRKSSYCDHTNFAVEEVFKLFYKFTEQFQEQYSNSVQRNTDEILVKYSDEDYKIIPILNIAKSSQCSTTEPSLVHYSLNNAPKSVNKMNGLFVGWEVISDLKVQKQIAEYLGYLRVNIKEAVDWIWNVSIRDLPVMELLMSKVIDNNLDYFSSFSENLMNSILISQNKNLRNLLPKKYEDPREYANELYKVYRPSNILSENLCYHIDTQSQLKVLLQLSEKDKFYSEVYKKMCVVKYDGFMPNSFRLVNERVNKYTQQYKDMMRKRYVYRNYDNLKALKSFYEQLIRECKRVQQGNFGVEVVRDMLLHMSKNYYHTYKDIILPLFISLTIIHSENLKYEPYRIKSPIKQEVQPSLTQQLLRKSNRINSFQRAISLILQKEQKEFHDAAKEYLTFHRKWENVVLNQYSEKGIAKNKQNYEEDFSQVFGKSQGANISKGANAPQKRNVPQNTVLDELYMLVRKRSGCTYELKLLKDLFAQTTSFHDFVVALELKYSNELTHTEKIDKNAKFNINKDYSLSISSKLCSSIPKILTEIKELSEKQKNLGTDQQIATLCNKIQERRVHDEVYQILGDCEHLIKLIDDLKSKLPEAYKEKMKAHSELEQQCLVVRRIQLNNWKDKLEEKIQRIQKSDTLDFVNFYKIFSQIGTMGETCEQQSSLVFKLCIDFFNQSKISCLDYRLHLLTLICQNLPVQKLFMKHQINRVINFFLSLKEPINEMCQNVKNEKIREMKQYETIASWNNKKYFILKTFIEKFQRNILQILKKYQEELSMQVQKFHSDLKEKLICNSLQQFSNTYKLKQQAQQKPIIDNLSKEEQQNINKFQKIPQDIFNALQKIKVSDDKLGLVKENFNNLKKIIEQLPIKAIDGQNQISQVLTKEMFDHENDYKKALKYYFGMYDKFNQKTQAKWQAELVKEVWEVSERIWININSRIPKYDIEIETEIDEETDDLKILFERFSKEKEQSKHHSIFEQELKKVQIILQKKQAERMFAMNKKYSKIENQQQILSLMKIGYLISSIALNLEKNGLCVKQNQEEGEQSGTQEVKDGVGIGQGEAHEHAQNVGDEMQFEEQFMGNKNEEKNNDANADKKQENDIQIDGDFDGDMYSKEEENEDEDNEAEEKEADEKMGDVDDEKREQDMKNDKGKAEGDKQADVEIEGQEQGEEDLVDNEQQSKQVRKGQNREEDSEGQQQKSDWDDNNDQGQKINKQNGGQMQEQENEEDQRNNEDQDGSISGSVKSEEQEEVNEDENNRESQMKDEAEEVKEQQQGSQQGNKQGQKMEEENNEEAQAEDQEPKQKKAKKTRRTNLQAFGRTDMNSNNPLKNNQDEVDGQDQQQNGGEADAKGATDGQKGSGDPVHSLSAELLKQIENLQRINAKNEANFMRDLNVVQHDENNEDAQEGNNDEQYQLTQQQNKASTNLPAFLDSQKQKEEDKNKRQIKEEQNERNQQKQQKKQTDEKSNENKSKIQKSQKADKQEYKVQESDEMKSEQVEENKSQDSRKNEKTQKQYLKVQKSETILQPSYQKLLTSLIDLTSIKQQEIKEEAMIDEAKQQTKEAALEEAFEISKILEEQLKSVLQPMDNAEYRGDYKTGKKLNLKKIIPFIASNFRKDKIWLRRTEPSERNYFVMLALDDTLSMSHGRVGNEALKGLLAISLALQHLSIKTCITGIRDSLIVYKEFQGLLETDKIYNSFKFSHSSDRSHDQSIANFIRSSLSEFKKSESAEVGTENKQLCFIISDGKMNKDYVRNQMREANKRDIIYVFIVIDSQNSSILSTKSVTMANGKLIIKQYMSDFPFEYYLIVRNVKELGEILATTVLQFIQQK